MQFFDKSAEAFAVGAQSAQPGGASPSSYLFEIYVFLGMAKRLRLQIASPRRYGLAVPPTFIPPSG